VTSAAIRFVLVEGADGDGATVDSGTLALTPGGTDTDALIEAVLGEGPYAAAPGCLPVAIGVTWSGAASDHAAALIQNLSDRGVDNVVALSPSEAAAALATGISDLAGHDELAVCFAEPDTSLVAVVTADSVVVDPVAGSDAAALAHAVHDTLDSTEARPAALYVLGSAGDLGALVGALQAGVGVAVISASEADLALARGAALASARGFAGVDAPFAPATEARGESRSRPTWRVPALTSVLAAAVVTFVVSVSVALGLQLTPQNRSESPQTEQMASASDQAINAPAAVTPQAPEAAPLPAAPPPAPEAPAPAPEAPPVDVAPAAPAPAPEIAPVSDPAVDAPEAAPAPEPAYVAPPAPVYVPPAPAYVPPAPAYVPPAPAAPAYVPPQNPGYVPPATAPQPRLRDRIIERLPIINRFHEPQYQP
jgi:hypothetical protein